MSEVLHVAGCLLRVPASHVRVASGHDGSGGPRVTTAGPAANQSFCTKHDAYFHIMTGKFCLPALA